MESELWPGLGGLLGASLAYLWVPLGKEPTASGVGPDPMSTALEDAGTETFPEAMALGYWDTENHVSNHMSWLWGSSRMWMPGYPGSTFCWALLPGM